MLRYYKFERLTPDSWQGKEGHDVLYDYSPYQEHCVLYDSSVWVRENVLGNKISSKVSSLQTYGIQPPIVEGFYTTGDGL